MMPSPITVASGIPRKQLQSFNNSLPIESQIIGGQSDEEWIEIGKNKCSNAIAPPPKMQNLFTNLLVLQVLKCDSVKLGTPSKK